MADPVIRSVATPTTSTGNGNVSAVQALASSTPGDMNVMVLSVASATAADPGVPTIGGVAISTTVGATAGGWTTIFTTADTSAAANMPRLSVAARIYQAGDPTSITVGWSLAGNHAAGSIAIQAGTFDASSIGAAIPDKVNTEQVPSSTSFTAPALTTSVRARVFTVAGNRTAGTWTAPSGDTIRTTAASSSSANFMISDSGATDPAGTSEPRVATFSAATSVGIIGEFGIAAAVANTAPVANAGPDQVNVEPFGTVTLAGSGTDIDGTIASYAWVQTAGDAVTLSGAATTAPTLTAPANISGTTLTFQLTVTDNGGATATDTVNVAVLPHTIWQKSAAGTLVPVQVTRKP